jgi:2-oxoglutarate dehydrogenase E2 component (dihydrolipoamide succinyltransferase)
LFRHPRCPAPVIPPVQDIPGISQLPQQPPVLSSVKFDNRFYSPLVKSIAVQEAIGNDELDHIPGTGVDGRLTKDDLLDYIKHRPKYEAPVHAVHPEPVLSEEPVVTYTAAIPARLYAATCTG